ncbi:hypothetical protein FGM00_13915 [Aggregatimonas sangjinii]|uniref:Uncharacterized protein n=1 Tax=Aggregatimonas sangjinii TaxID=2583587 RepID=A0A5B7SVI2_9FLAO|nr:hypothetical protein [Aggregatimonas sangjinii]QCX01153.1 hypothetical protein FGM00_13915 [Aggregatimonas sangjinii]
MISWKSISIFGNSQLINRSYIYLFIVPIFAKLLSKLQSPLKFKIEGKIYELVLELPFSWTMFFASAFLFTIASILYYYAAPSIIKENKSFGTFLIDRKDIPHISNYAEGMGITRKWFVGIGMGEHEDFSPLVLFENLKHQSDELKEETVIDIEEIKKISNQKKLKVYKEVHRKRPPNEEKEEFMQSKFWSVYDYANSSKKTSRIICASLYGLGFAFILVVILQGAWTVLQMW